MLRNVVMGGLSAAVLALSVPAFAQQAVPGGTAVEAKTMLELAVAGGTQLTGSSQRRNRGRRPPLRSSLWAAARSTTAGLWPWRSHGGCARSSPAAISALPAVTAGWASATRRRSTSRRRPTYAETWAPAF
jgi:hypothetical protein